MPSPSPWAQDCFPGAKEGYIPSLVIEGREARWVGEREVEDCVRVRDGEAGGEVWVWGCEEGEGVEWVFGGLVEG